MRHPAMPVGACDLGPERYARRPSSMQDARAFLASDAAARLDENEARWPPPSRRQQRGGSPV